MIRKIHQIFAEIFFDPMPLLEFKDYDDYWDKRIEQQAKYRFVWVASRLPETGKVIDLGCGDGAFIAYASQIKPHLKLIGLDASASAIRKLDDRGLTGEIIADLNRPDLSQFIDTDVFVAMELIEHLSEPELLMEELLKTNATTFYITIPNLGFIVNRLRLAIGGKMPITAIVYHIKEHLRFWTVRDFHYWAQHCGFEVTEYYGQNGFFGLWKIFPSLFARQMIYMLKKSKVR